MAVQYAFGKIVTQGLDLNVDAADPTSYPGSGTTWTSVVNRSITGSLVSCSYSSDFKGGIVFNNPTASVIFPGTVANYGTGSFTIEMAFRPTQIQGIHYLMSKNSGSFPNWGIYLSGSGGSGKLWAEYRISSTVSCSVSSSSTFVTGSNYFVDAIFDPGGRRIYMTSQGLYDSISIPSNGSGSLTNTGSVFLGNTVTSSSQAFSGSIYTSKIYSISLPGENNFRVLSSRLQQSIPTRSTAGIVLVVGGGGSGGTAESNIGGDSGGGGGAGGVILSTFSLTPGTYPIFVGPGGLAINSDSANGQNGGTSSFSSLIAYGGGGGGGGSGAGLNGASGGGGGAESVGLAPGQAIYSWQGNNGGSGSNSRIGGGGGGALTSGQNATTSAGNGGSGILIPFFSTIGGSPAGYFAGGGGGGAKNTFPTPGSGGIGGGGSGSSGTVGTSGIPNTGGGGGGGYPTGAPGLGGNGGSGIVAIQYYGNPIATGGEITQSAGYTYHVFRQTGSSTFTVF